MIDFACKKFNLDDIIKCGLGLTKTEFQILEFFIQSRDKEFTTDKIATKLKLNLSTVQKAVKKLREQNILRKQQKNLSSGGYVYTYEINPKSKVREIIKDIIKEWSSRVEQEIDKW